MSHMLIFRGIFDQKTAMTTFLVKIMPWKRGTGSLKDQLESTIR